MKFTTAIITSLFLCFIFVFSSNAQTTDTNKSSEKQTEKQKGDKPLKIKKKPYASIGNCSQPRGLAKVKVTFDKSAKITKAEIFKSSGCEDFDKNVINAALEIKFEPKIVNGEPVTTIKILQYTFTQSSK